MKLEDAMPSVAVQCDSCNPLTDGKTVRIATDEELNEDIDKLVEDGLREAGLTPEGYEEAMNTHLVKDITWATDEEFLDYFGLEATEDGGLKIKK